jgi:murein DD-endopeptidase MepM/ murein hydrolase activator NlpD
MNSSLLYLLQVSLLFGSFYLVYKFLFSKFTFHAVNRSVLLVLIPLSLLLPFSAALFPQIELLTTQLPFIEEFTAFQNLEYFADESSVGTLQTIHYSFWVLLAYALGVVCHLVRFSLTTFVLVKLKRKAQKIQSNNTILYRADVSETFSYFNWIFIPATEIVDELIITHEKAHRKQLHSVDVILTELFIAFFWFHPLAYLYRKSLKSIHEFQADAFVLKEYAKKSTYLELLLKSLEPKNTNPVFNYFSHPTLKKRIEMITKSPSKNSSKLVYLLLIPVLAFAFMAFTSANENIVSNAFIPTTIKISGTPSIFPVQNGNMQHISSSFGKVRKHSKLKNTTPHGGIDIRATRGTPVIATADGVIVKAKKDGNWGNLIVISHSDGFETWYAHLKGFNIKERAIVKKGDIIGYVGNTGLSTAPHLHYEVHQHGKRLDPMNYITE